jgi:hypothetical protein
MPFLAASDGDWLFLIAFFAILITQSFLLLIFPESARSIILGWNEMWGIRIDPKSRGLSNGRLRIAGVFGAGMIVYGAVMLWRARHGEL